MRYVYFILIAALAINACSREPKQDSTITNDSLDTAQVTEHSIVFSSVDTMIVDKKAAVFIGPDSASIEKRKKQLGEETFYIGADDYLFYLATAREFLDSMKLTVIDNQDNRVLKFVREDGSHQIVELDGLRELWAIFFFEPSKDAKMVDMTVINEEYREYFE